MKNGAGRGQGGDMEDQKKGYTFQDKRGRKEEPGKAAEREASPGGGEGPSASGQEYRSDVDFSTLIMSFASAAVISMGRMPDPATGQTGRNPALARQNIHIIEMLRDKTRGNLTRDEETLIENILYELKLSFVESQP
jgi:hypothetical protein